MPTNLSLMSRNFNANKMMHLRRLLDQGIIKNVKPLNLLVEFVLFMFEKPLQINYPNKFAAIIPV